MEITLALNRKDLTRVSAIFIRGENIHDYLYDVHQVVGDMVRLSALERLAASGDRMATRVMRSMYVKHEHIKEGVRTEIGSKFQGYPTSKWDVTGDAEKAARKGWATLAHRMEFGYYPGAPRLQNPYNPAAGRTSPTHFLVKSWEQQAKTRGGFVNRLATDVVDQILKGRRF